MTNVVHWLRAVARIYGKKYVDDAFRWRAGRQGTGYYKMLLLLGKVPIPFDTYLLKYPEGSEIPLHTDPAPIGGKHFRINVVLKESPVGGIFVCDKPLYRSRRVAFFRPDVSKHSVTKVEGGTRYVLSIGWLR